MTLEAAFKEQLAKWEGLVEELEHGLLWSVTETKPEEEHTLVTQYLDAATDLISHGPRGPGGMPGRRRRGAEPRTGGAVPLAMSGTVQRHGRVVQLPDGVIRLAPAIASLRPRKGGRLARLGSPGPEGAGPLPPAHGRPQPGAVQLLARGSRSAGSERGLGASD